MFFLACFILFIAGCFIGDSTILIASGLFSIASAIDFKKLYKE